MKILFLARQPPIPADNGSRIRARGLASELSRAARLHLLAFEGIPDSDRPASSEAAVARALPEAEAVTLVRRPKQGKRRRQMQTMLGGSSYGLALHQSTAMANTLHDVIASFKPDVLHCNSMLLGDYLRSLPTTSAVRAIAPENTESMLMRRMAEDAGSWARRRLYLKEAARLKGWEAAHLREFDLCLGVSDEDTLRFAGVGANAVCVPNAVERHPQPHPVTRLQGDERLKLLFVGSGAWEPNRRGMIWFAEKVLPLLRCRLPPSVTIIGSDWDWFHHSLCVNVGYVSSLDEHYATHHVALVPLLSGGGSRLKVAEALAKGVPVLGTSIGLEGYRLKPGIQALLADTPDDFAAQAQWLDEKYRHDPGAVDRLIAAGFKLVQGFFWDEVGSRLVEVYAEAVKDRREKHADERQRSVFSRHVVHAGSR